jgi:FixJ family two-component response regulator
VIRLRRKQVPLSPEPLRIVVVDDEELIVHLIEHLICAKYDVAVQSFTSSQAAWQELERTSPDMLIVGGIMPELLGEEIVRRLMARQATYPILVVSGHLSAEAVLGWFSGAPHISFLRKPFTSEQIHAEIEKHFETALPPR